MPDETKFIERVRDVVAEFVKKDAGDVAVSEIKGGFTGASKFNADNFFLKAADTTTHALDAFLIESEAKIYSLLKRLKLAGSIFPEYVGLIDRDGLKVLIVEFLSQVTWGGPWNEETIRMLDEALHKLHTTQIDEKDLVVIEKLSNDVCLKLGQDLRPKNLSEEEIVEKNKLFFDAWNTVGRGFVDSKGVIYFFAKEDLAEKIIGEAKKDIGNEDRALIMHDLNFANIGFSNRQAYFVDPLFLRMGLADSDRTVVGVNILQQLGQNGNEELKKLVVNKYITDKTVLAKLIKYYVISSAVKLDESRSGWQKFHQECSIVALNLFQDWDTEVVA